MLKNGLDTKLENQLIKKVKDERCSNSILKLVEKYRKMGVSLISRHKPNNTSSYTSPTDIEDRLTSCVYSAADKFDPSKGTKFSTWLAHQIIYSLLNEKRNLNLNNYIEIDEVENVLKDEKYASKAKENEFFEDVFYTLSELKDPRILRIFQMRYTEGKKARWKEIGDVIGYSGETARLLHRKGLQFLRQKIQKFL